LQATISRKYKPVIFWIPVQVGQGLVIPKCMSMIRAEDVIRGLRFIVRGKG